MGLPPVSKTKPGAPLLADVARSGFSMGRRRRSFLLAGAPYTKTKPSSAQPSSSFQVIFWPTMPVSKSNSRPTVFIPDDRQREAIDHVDGPMLVVAGAGTGKTSVLTHRIERLVRGGHARTDQILALTYTVNAAKEMQQRVRALLGGKTVQAATFHDYCLQLLK